jgi:hypothetical protein
MCSHAQAGVQTQSAAQLADCSAACSSTLQSWPRAALSAPQAVGGVTSQRCSQQRAELLNSSSSRRQRKTFLPKVPLPRAALMQISAQRAAAAVVTTTEQRSLQQRLPAAAESKQQQGSESGLQLGTYLFFFLPANIFSQQYSSMHTTTTTAGAAAVRSDCSSGAPASRQWQHMRGNERESLHLYKSHTRRRGE